ncbi:hypothetical protein C7C46_08410 [Streptomyces tateyamensis]|uniref:YcaO domain-containing protein n=1 Tax=Streptomyces tateyamensis TaxID=565073 RepID=A0A2V4NFD1_9ACTN|nr:hypothetical protein C7C46_08410 [Streptomyces tateyamensis]
MLARPSWYWMTLRLTPALFGIPTFAAFVWSPLFPIVCAGSGSHMDPEVAVSRALTEAVQSRLTEISSTRDDIPSDLDLYWKGTPSAEVSAILATLPSGVSASVVPAKYSRADLHAARDKLLSGGKPIQLHVASSQKPIHINTIAPAVDGSGLQIGFDTNDGAVKAAASPLDGSVSTDEVKALTDSLTGVPTSVTNKPAPENTSRQQDSSPFYGGAALMNPTGGICSSGFAVAKSTGEHLLTTALHCDGGNGEFKTYWGGSAVGLSTTYNGYANDDILGLQLNGRSSAGYLYDGPALETDGYAKPVSGWGQNYVGDYVCTDGANSGVHCNVQLTQTDIGVGGVGGYWRPHTDLGFATSYTPDGIAAANGDSGGPVFVGRNNYTTDEARGTITALDRTVTCPSNEQVLDAGVRTPWCLAGVYYVPIGQTLSDMGWTLVTQ